MAMMMMVMMATATMMTTMMTTMKKKINNKQHEYHKWGNTTHRKNIDGETKISDNNTTRKSAGMTNWGTLQCAVRSGKQQCHLCQASRALGN